MGCQPLKLNDVLIIADDTKIAKGYSVKTEVQCFTGRPRNCLAYAPCLYRSSMTS